MEMVAIREEQRDLVQSELANMCLGDLAPLAEEAIMGRATAVEVLRLIRGAWKVGWLLGQQAAVEQHNRLLRGDRTGTLAV